MSKTIVLDANILMRAVLGSRVDGVLGRYADRVRFVTVDEAFADARAYLPPVITQHKGGEEAVGAALEKLQVLARMVQVGVLVELRQNATLSRLGLRT